MDVSPNTLRKETVQVLGQIQGQIDEIYDAASSRGVSQYKMTDERGNYSLSPLLLGKAQCLHTLTLLNEQGRRK